VSIPVIGNGGIDAPRRAMDAASTSHCDAVMIGKAAIYNPGIFTVDRPGAKHPEPGLVKERLKWLHAYLDLAIQHGCLKASRLEQRAKDFLRGFIPEATISKLKAAASDETDFVERLTKEAISS
jgi:tRNA-dihydrouridine synthase